MPRKISSVLDFERLDFLETYFPARTATIDRFQHARWLKSKFHGEVWQCQFDKAKFVIDWRARVGQQGELLTSRRNANLLQALRCWLIISTHVDGTGGQLISSKTEYERIRATLATIDYLLINADAYGLPDHGLKSLSSNDLVAVLGALVSSPQRGISVYQWPQRTSAFLRARASELSRKEYREVRDKLPAIELGLQDNRHVTDLTLVETAKARAWAWLNHLYRPGYGDDEFAWVLVTKKLAVLAYPDTIATKDRLGQLPEMGICPRQPNLREYEAVPVSTPGSVTRKGELLAYRNTIARLGLLHDIVESPSAGALQGFNELTNINAFEYRETDRFKTLPANVVFGSLRNAIDFHLNYGESLVDSYLSLAKAATKHGKSICRYALAYSISDCISPSLKKLGVRQWSVEPSNAGASGGPKPLSPGEYFMRFRKNEGLWELMAVWYGAVQVILGTLTARRVDELCDLIAGSSLDRSWTRLVFDNRKSGAAGQRQTISRPLPSIGADAISQIERLQEGLMQCGLLDRPTNLLARPRYMGETPLVNLRADTFNFTNDIFCDYFETPKDLDGRRYYLRQHQLRRFFAMLFFWGNSFSGLDVLREFLGHTNSEHVYRYITESTPGALLRDIKIEWAGQAVKEQWECAKALATLIQDHFGTSDFKVLRDDDLNEYIETLMEDGTVTVEPEFLDEGNQYRILVRVTAKAS